MSTSTPTPTSTSPTAPSPFAEHILTLSSGGILAYTHCGNTQSRRVILSFHTIGRVGKHTLSRTLAKYDVHYIALTLPGWGNSSPFPFPSNTNRNQEEEEGEGDGEGMTYQAYIIQSTTELLRHLGVDENDEEVKIYLSGTSLGSIPAQMLFSTTTTSTSTTTTSSSFPSFPSIKESFPYRARVKGCLLISPFTPPKHHPTYTKGMSWATYITFAVAPYIPFNILGRLVKPIMARRTSTYEDAERMVDMVFDRMSEEEKERLRGWEKESGREEGAIKKEMTENARINNNDAHATTTWDGLSTMARVIHSDWGFVPREVDGRGMIIAACKGDEVAPVGHAEWLHEAYVGSELTVFEESGHLGMVYHIDEVWEGLLREERTSDIYVIFTS